MNNSLNSIEVRRPTSRSGITANITNSTGRDGDENDPPLPIVDISFSSTANGVVNSGIDSRKTT
jgi:hypothetical protein